MEKQDLNTYIGDMGPYQWRVFITVFIFAIYTADAIHIIFIAGKMPHWCHVPELNDLPYDVQKNVAIPAESVNCDGSIEYSSCEMFSLNYSIYNRSQFYSWNRSLIITNDTSVVECSQWTYDQSQFISTIVSKFNLVCGYDFLVEFASTAYMAGVLIGALASGAMSDRFGRKKTVLCFFGVKITGILMSWFGNSYMTFVVGRFLVGFGQVGFYIPAFVLVMELVGQRYRPGLGTAIQVAFSLGYMLQPVIAYRLRDEFWYQVAATSPNLIFPFIVIFLIPESPRWLAVHGKYDQVSQLLMKICRTNGRPFPEDFDPASLVDEPNVVKRQNCCGLLTSSTLRLRTLIVDFSWMTCSLIYYALALNTGALHGDIYINSFVSGALEIPAYIICVFMMNWKLLGRRWTGCLGLVGSGISCFLCIPMILSGNNTATVVFSMLGKSLICIAYSVVYVFGNEIFPTEVRNVGVGTAIMGSHVTSMTAAYVGGPMASFWKPLPSLVFGIFATVAGLLYVCMPETLGHVLPDTVEQAEQFGRCGTKKLGLKCSVSGESASDEELTEPCDKPMIVDVVEVKSIFAIDGNGSAMYVPNSDETSCLKVRL